MVNPEAPKTKESTAAASSVATTDKFLSFCQPSLEFDLWHPHSFIFILSFITLTADGRTHRSRRQPRGGSFCSWWRSPLSTASASSSGHADIYVLLNWTRTTSKSPSSSSPFCGHKSNFDKSFLICTSSLSRKTGTRALLRVVTVNARRYVV